MDQDRHNRNPPHRPIRVQMICSGFTIPKTLGHEGLLTNPAYSFVSTSPWKPLVTGVFRHPPYSFVSNSPGSRFIIESCRQIRCTPLFPTVLEAAGCWLFPTTRHTLRFPHSRVPLVLHQAPENPEYCVRFAISYGTWKDLFRYSLYREPIRHRILRLCKIENYMD